MFDMNTSMPSLRVDPRKFHKLAKVIQGAVDNEDLVAKLLITESSLIKSHGQVSEKRFELAKANNNLMQEIRNTVRRDPMMSFADQERDIDRFSHTMSGRNFLRISFECVNLYTQAHEVLLTICRDLTPGDLLMTEGSSFNSLKKLNFEALQKLTFETQLNSGVVERFISGVMSLAVGRSKLIELGRAITNIMDKYYMELMNRHQVEGVKIHGDPVITDIAISIFENIDSHGEIESGKSREQLSAYSLHKAEIMVEALRHPSVKQFITEPEAFLNYIITGLKNLWDIVNELTVTYTSIIKEVEDTCGKADPYGRKVDESDYLRVVQIIKDLNPYSISEKEPTRLLTSEEIYNINFKNETLAKIVGMLKAPATSITELIYYVLDRKAELHDFFRNENSFYVCRIGAGNSFLGEAPGALTVVPGSKPNINLDDIIGSGFNEIRSFVTEIEAAAKWHDLFVATSPSKTADKANVLLIGPQGCGKTEALRAVASDRKSIGIFAQGSDFMTCWKGEAEKNPKRLFEAAVKLQREADRHVHILIDEIDSVLKKQELTQHGEFNLTLEFQILMDGLVHYRGISVWGTTNHPERLPMPMLRRFNKVLIVGELDQSQRVKLLKYFIGFMPVDNFDDTKWAGLAEKLNGATGDVIRKVVDHIWRTKMTWFVQNHQKEAIELIDSLNNGEKFEIAKFDDKRRFNLNQRLSKYFSISAEDVGKSIDEHLVNVAIHNEIQTAKDTYREAKEFLEAVSNKQVA